MSGGERRRALGVPEGDQQAAAGGEGAWRPRAVLASGAAGFARDPRREPLGKPHRDIAARIDPKQQRTQQEEKRNRRYENLDHRDDKLAHRPNAN
jgi:hypothetical protein